MKKCNRCKVEKKDSDFRIRTSRYKESVYEFLNNTCKQCDAELSGQYYHKNRTPEMLAKNASRVKKYNSENKDKIRIRQKKKRSTPEYKAYMKKYREKRKQVIYQQELITKKRYHEKNRNEISDKYAIRLLKQSGNTSPSQDDVEIKKIQINAQNKNANFKTNSKWQKR